MRAALAIVLVLAACSRHLAPPVSPALRALATPAAFAQVRPGMRQVDVEALLGPPHAIDFDLTWRGVFVAFYPGPDAWRLTYHYDGVGDVVLAYGTLSKEGEVVAIRPQ